MKKARKPRNARARIAELERQVYEHELTLKEAAVACTELSKALSTVTDALTELRRRVDAGPPAPRKRKRAKRRR